MKSYKPPIYLGLGAAPSVCVALKAWGAYNITTGNPSGGTWATWVKANGLYNISATDASMAPNGE